MNLWIPDRVYFEPEALDYPLGSKVHKFCKENNIDILETTAHHQVRNIPGETEKEKFANAKKTLVVGIKKSLDLCDCRPSADYQFSLMTNCPGNCEYCYLFSTQGKRPYVRVYVNIKDLFATIDKYIENGLPNTTYFEAASTGDPLGVEHITGTLRECINYFGTLDKGRLRVVTKYSNVDSILDAHHNGHTRFRFSISSNYVIENFEHNTHDLSERLEAAGKMAKAGYPLGFIVAPIMRHSEWKYQYGKLFENLHKQIKIIADNEISFELIQHRFTTTAKNVILERFPNTKLDMDESSRKKKWGRYGRVKYVYPKDEAQEIKEYITELIHQYFPNANIEYFT